MKPEEFYHHVYHVKEKTPYSLCTLCIDILRDDAYRVRLNRGEQSVDNMTPMVDNDITDPHCQVRMEENSECITLSTRKFSLKIFKTDFHMELCNAEREVLTRSGKRPDNGFAVAYDAYPLGFIRDRRHKRWYAVESFELAHDEAVYGLGEHFGPLNKVGQTLRLWIYEGTGNTSGRVYKAVPFFVSNRGYGVFFNHSVPITFWVGSKEFTKTQIAVEETHLDYFVFTGAIAEILEQYTALTGRPAMPPRYSFGTWISRMSYNSQAEMLEVARILRKKQFPADVIHLDDNWFRRAWLCDWQFDPDRFPDPQGMCETLHDMGFRVSLWQEPYILKGTELWDEAKEKGYLAKCSVPFLFASHFEAAPIDFTNPEAAKWYQDRLLRPLLEMGIDVIKTDFGEGIEPATQFKEGDGHALHNLYPLLYNRAAFEVTQDLHGDDAMVWGRSGYAGSQRYPVQWSGDNGASFGSMRCSLRGGLSLGLSGYTFWSQDTGGFVGDPTDELYIRWTQLSIFQSHLRYHGCHPFREPWQFSEPTQKIVRQYLNLRYQLIPYLYSESLRCAGRGLPLMSPLVVYYQDDPTVMEIDDQFLCGRDILVAPFLKSNSRRTFYIPEGTWYELFSGEPVEGRQWLTRSYPVDKMPAFVRAGTILPLAPVTACTAALDNDHGFHLRVFLDRHKGAEYTLKEKNRSLHFVAKWQDSALHIESDNTRPVLSVEAYKNGIIVDQEQIVIDR